MLAEIDIESTLVIIKTKGDQIQHLGFDKIEGKGFFTKEIEDALLSDDIDVAVHSMKDLPTIMEEELTIAGLSDRADPSDILIIGKDAHDPHSRMKIKSGSTVGTSSIRRKVQLVSFDDSLVPEDIRGNVTTRIKKIDEGIVDAIILASAGIDRLKIDLSDYITLRFNPTEFIPAPAQGVNAYQCRSNDKSMRRILRTLHKTEVSKCTNIEREILKLLDGGCQLPLGAYVVKDDGGFHCHAMLGTVPGAPLKRYQYSQSTSAGMAAHIVSQLKN
ncbi:UNVERIFIED_CONTAM: hypothetical protein GTU68_039644 [Idotea baltica]|nr:hypothetical protein [Idotea baltica]